MKELNTACIPVVTEEPKKNRCLSCGATENMGRRKYCSVECRQKLRHYLNVRTGLLRALNIRYGTFYFTDYVIVMDLLPYSSKDIFSYIFPRTPGQKPAHDFSRMANILGNAWWDEKRRTNKRYLASIFVFNQAVKNQNSADIVKPREIVKPANIGKSLMHLKLSKEDLNSPGLQQLIKSAYRFHAKKHHPDLGGDSHLFRTIHDAYEQLIDWAENPVFTRRRGFPDKWFYDAMYNKWTQPTPGKK